MMFTHMMANMMHVPPLKLKAMQKTPPDYLLETHSERALDRVYEKLLGTNNGDDDDDDDVPLSVERQVDDLIAQAVDKNNLAQMYVGWAAYL